MLETSHLSTLLSLAVNAEEKYHPELISTATKVVGSLSRCKGLIPTITNKNDRVPTKALSYKRTRYLLTCSPKRVILLLTEGTPRGLNQINQYSNGNNSQPRFLALIHVYLIGFVGSA